MFFVNGKGGKFPLNGSDLRPSLVCHLGDSGCMCSWEWIVVSKIVVFLNPQLISIRIARQNPINLVQGERLILEHFKKMMLNIHIIYKSNFALFDSLQATFHKWYRTGHPVWQTSINFNYWMNLQLKIFKWQIINLVLLSHRQLNLFDN